MAYGLNGSIPSLFLSITLRFFEVCLTSETTSSKYKNQRIDKAFIIFLLVITADGPGLV